MSTADLANILGLPVEDRLHLVELIWESLMGTPNAVPFDDAHRAAVDAELEAHRRDPEDVLSLEQLMSGVRASR